MSRESGVRKLVRKAYGTSRVAGVTHSFYFYSKINERLVKINN